MPKRFVENYTSNTQCRSIKDKWIWVVDMSGNVGEWRMEQQFSQTDPLGHPSGSPIEIRDLRVSNRR